MVPKFKCTHPNCNFLSNSSTGLKLHGRIHQKWPLRICSEDANHFRCTFRRCLYRGSKEIFLAAHIANCHNPTRPGFSCPWCLRTMRTKEGYQNHLKWHKGDRPYTCTYCDYGTVHITGLREHIRRHELDNQGLPPPKSPKKYKCDECDYTAPSAARVKLHSVVHKPEKPFACSFPGCTYRAKWVHNMEEHEERHDPMLNKRFKCPICPRRFCREYQVFRHVRTHTQERDRECPDCDYRAATLVQVRRHQRNHHRNRTRSTTDRKSTKKASKIVTTKSSRSPHRNESWQSYTSCGFRRSLRLLNHAAMKSKVSAPKPKITKDEPIRTRSTKHTSEQQKLVSSPRGTAILDSNATTTPTATVSKCLICGLPTSCPSRLTTHMKVHLDERPFVCSYTGCDFRTKWERSLVVHKNRHNRRSGAFVFYSCPQVACNFATSDAALANKHRYVHHIILKKTLKCSVCPKKYVSKQGYVEHMRVHRGEKPYKCSLCGYKDSVRRKVMSHYFHCHEEK